MVRRMGPCYDVDKLSKGQRCQGAVTFCCNCACAVPSRAFIGPWTVNGLLSARC